MRTLLTFLYSGMYNVVYPKTGTRSRNNSTTSLDGGAKTTAASSSTSAAAAHTHAHKHDGCCGAPPAPTPSADDKAQYERAMKMLKGIDLAISGKVEEEEVVADIESVVETVTGMFVLLLIKFVHFLTLICELLYKIKLSLSFFMI